MKSQAVEEERKGHKMNFAGGNFHKLKMGAEKQERSPGGPREVVRLPGGS